MVQARVRNGRVEVEEPLPADWEGQLVNITALTPDDPIADLDSKLAALHALGPMEYEPGEREMIEAELADINEVSKQEIAKLVGQSH
jgi:hypothetical protein